MSTTSISIALTGSGGAGVVITGQLLLRAVGKAGLFGLMHRSAGPQIRGGESLAMLRFSNEIVEAQDDTFSLLFALDWKNFSRFSAEVPLHHYGKVFADEKAGETPEVLASRGVRVNPMPLSETASRVKGGRPNMVLLGRLGRFLDIPLEILLDVTLDRLQGKGDVVLGVAIQGIESGYEQGLEFEFDRPQPNNGNKTARWLISGNEAAGLGALHAGVRFVAAYPITPASDVLEWMSPRLEQLGGRLVQAEDELASINMLIGASWGGVPALTATSGPGLALMTEALGLAVASETPVTVLDVMRGGPSTGIPTKSEQSDLNIALYGLHGDAPHLVTAPLSITDCAFTTAWTIGLSEKLQVPSIILSDQSLGQSQAVTAPVDLPPSVSRERAAPTEGGYLRYQQSQDNVSPMAVPGDPMNMYTADGLEHNEAGIPSTVDDDHRKGLAKRRNKLERFDYGAHWAYCEGSGDIVLVTWGSLNGAVKEAAARLNALGTRVRTIGVRLLLPMRVSQFCEAVSDARRIIVVEQNEGAQLLNHLRANCCLDKNAESLARPGPLPIRPGEIVEFVNQGPSI